MGKILLILVSLGVIGTVVWSNIGTPAQEAIVGFIPTLSTSEEMVLTPHITVTPAKPVQGEPALISVEGVGIEDIDKIKFAGEELGVFLYEGKPSALVGIDLNAKTGIREVELELKSADGATSTMLAVNARKKPQRPLGIPEKLGGNTTAAEKDLISTLVREGRIISAVPSSDVRLWSKNFRFPVDEVTVTDVYGYSRVTGASVINHKGTDFRAKVGTPVYAMNDGSVAYTGALRNYGNTIIIDHGLGLHTVYMHLSKVDVKKGAVVVRGQMIGKSGDTGYVLGPHLHLSVRINDISIDPMTFMEILGDVN